MSRVSAHGNEVRIRCVLTRQFVSEREGVRSTLSAARHVRPRPVSEEGQRMLVVGGVCPLFQSGAGGRKMIDGRICLASFRGKHTHAPPLVVYMEDGRYELVGAAALERSVLNQYIIHRVQRVHIAFSEYRIIAE